MTPSIIVPAVMNAADEVAVEAFLSEKIGFNGIYDTVRKTVDMLSLAREAKTVEDILAYDQEARRVAASIIK